VFPIPDTAVVRETAVVAFTRVASTDPRADG
jgi:hypothetical protein